MAKQKQPKKEEPTLDPTSKIEAIKQLIFGENIEQYDSEFDTLKKEIQQKKEALETYVDQVREELMQSIDSLSTDVNIRITDLEAAVNDKTEALDSAKVNKTELGDLLIKLGEKIRS
ncbi:MAG: fructose 1,6-bisphosphatase [Gilvibacter sp.]